MRDPFAQLTQQTWMQIKSIWMQQSPGLRHEDNTFGHLVCIQQDHLIFNLEYEGWQIQFNPDTAEIEILKTSIELDPKYIIERLALPFLRFIRGAVLWHASAISYKEHIYSFLAPSGIGKTTITAALLSSQPEAKLVSDDILPLIPSENTTLCLPSTSHLAMRHDLFNHQYFVEYISSLRHKKLLFLKSHHYLQQSQTLKEICILSSGKNHIPAQITMSQAVPMILNQQMTMSHLPNALKKYQFQACMQIIRNCNNFYKQEIPLYAWDDVVSHFWKALS